MPFLLVRGIKDVLFLSVPRLRDTTTDVTVEKGKKAFFPVCTREEKHKSFEFIKMQEGSLGKEREKSATSYFRRAKPNPSYF